MMSVELHRANLKSLITDLDGQFIGVDFVKVDGSKRKLNGRLGVKRYLKGGDCAVTRLDLPYLVVFDVKILGYRHVNLATVSKLRSRHTEYTVIG